MDRTRKKRRKFLKLAKKHDRDWRNLRIALHNQEESFFYDVDDVSLFGPGTQHSPLASFVDHVVRSNTMREEGPVGENAELEDLEVLRALLWLTPNEFYSSRAAYGLVDLVFLNMDVLVNFLDHVEESSLRARPAIMFASERLSAPTWLAQNLGAPSFWHALVVQTARSTHPWIASPLRKQQLHAALYGVLEHRFPEWLAMPTGDPGHNDTPIGTYLAWSGTRDVSEEIGKMLDILEAREVRGSIDWEPLHDKHVSLMRVAVETENPMVVQVVYEALTPDERARGSLYGGSALRIQKRKVAHMERRMDPDDPTPESVAALEKARAVLRILEDGSMMAGRPKSAFND